jgi:DNA-binding transcriptional LysR family regulator
LNVVTSSTATSYRELRERKVELAMGRINDLVGEENVVAESLFDCAMVVFAARRNPWTRRRRIGRAELMNEPGRCRHGALSAQAFRAQGLKLPRSAVTTASLDMRKRLVATGRFLTILPRQSHQLI